MTGLARAMMDGMDDQSYARRLFAILANPHPTGVDPEDPYGQTDDGIDRHDGFGRDVWVESVKVVDGEHGAELEVEFGLAPASSPELGEVPPRGTLRLPMDTEWRQLSGYTDPAAYAPAVAHAVEMSAWQHVARHLRAQGSERERPALPAREAQWQLLLDALGSEGATREIAPGRIEVRGTNGGVVTVLISPDQWEHVLLEEAWSEVDLYVDGLLGPRQDDETFVVFYNGRLHRSTREELPPVRGTAEERKVAEAHAAHPNAVLAWRADAPSDQGDDPTQS